MTSMTIGSSCCSWTLVQTVLVSRRTNRSAIAIEGAIMQLTPQNVEIGNFKIGTWDLVIALIFLIIVMVVGLYFVGHANAETWKRVTLAAAGIGTFLSGIFVGRRSTSNEGH